MRLEGLGEIGKAETFEKCGKSGGKVVKMRKNVEKVSKKYKNAERFYHKGTKKN